jgi:transposase
MRKLRDVLRLKYESHLPQRAIAQACGVGLGTITAYLQRARGAGLTWPVPGELDDAALEARLFTRPAAPPASARALPDWSALHQELKQPGVTLMLLWHEYRAQQPRGYAYSQFCERYRQWARRLKPSMRQVHRAGEKLFVDFSGKRPHLVDPRTGEASAVELFVGVLGASGLIYAEATWRQDVASWINAHIRMLEYFQGSPAVWVPDNLKSGVTHAHPYEPEVNRTYLDLAQHYGAAVIPTRVARPKDKPKAEVSIQIAQRWILAALRHHTFFTLAELNAAIHARLEAINARPMKVVGVSRRTLFEQLDRPALRSLPAARYELAEWKRCRVNIDYHVEIDHNFYSVPYQLVHESVDARFTAATVEVFFRSQRVASHARVPGRGRFITLVEHMPRAHRAHAEWTPSRLIAWATQTGPATGRLVAGILERRPHPEQGYRACLGLMRLGREYGTDRLEAASARAERLGSYRFRTVEHILRHHQDRLPLEESIPTRPTLTHENVRGAAYYEEVYADPPDDRQTPGDASGRDGRGV